MTQEAKKQSAYGKPEPYPFVCANCRWARSYTPPNEMLCCCRYPEPLAKPDSAWCGEFSAAVNRSMRADLPFPSCQVVPHE